MIWRWALRMRPRNRLSDLRWASYQVIIWKAVGLGGGLCRVQVVRVILSSGPCSNVGSSQCFRGEPSMAWALLHDGCVLCER